MKRRFILILLLALLLLSACSGTSSESEREALQAISSRFRLFKKGHKCAP